MGIDKRVTDICAAISTDSTSAELRARAGDVYTGALYAGADHERAIEIANNAHLDQQTQLRMAQIGGLFVGVEAVLIGNTEI